MVSCFFNQAESGVQFCTAGILTSGIRLPEPEKFIMRRHELPSASPRSASVAVRRGSATESLWVLNQRLVNAERELRVQFIRIAQLQAQLDMVMSALRAARNDGSVTDRVLDGGRSSSH